MEVIFEARVMEVVTEKAGAVQPRHSPLNVRVRAHNARRQSTHAHHQNGLHEIKAIEPHTLVVIARQLSRVLYRPMRQTFSPILSWPEDFAAASVGLVWRCWAVGEAPPYRL
jgi:hypothetical protein